MHRMLCSICKRVEITSEDRQTAACPNNHVYCEKCLGAVSDKCLLCAGRLYEYIAPVTKRIWSPEMILEWSQKNALTTSISQDSLEDDKQLLGEDCDAASMKLLFSRPGGGEVESSLTNDSMLVSDTLCKHSLTWGKINDSKQQKLLGADPKCSRSVQTADEAIDNLKLDEKDARQMKQDLRKLIMDEILKSYNKEHWSEQSPKKAVQFKQFQTIGVSTESTPKLLPEDSLISSSLTPPIEGIHSAEKEPPYNRPPAEYLLMNVATGTVKTPQLPEIKQKKSDASNTDQRLQQIMGILLESVKPPSSEDQHFYKFLREKFSRMPLVKLEEILSSIYSQGEEEKKIEAQAPVKNDAPAPKSLDMTLVPNCRRAYYNPPPATTPPSSPAPQFQLIRMSAVNMSKELIQTEIIDGTLNIPRRPVICPINSCQRAFFVADFTKHIAVDHTKVPLEGICPQQCKNFLLDPKLIHFGANRCQVLLLVKNKIVNLGHERFKDFVPILVMTTRLSLLEICSKKPEEVEKKMTENFVMIWLTGIIPPQLPIFFSLTVWARSGLMPVCHLVHSGRLYSVRESQNPEVVRKSGQMLLLSNNQIDFLTNAGRNMLELQITVH